MRKCVVTRYRTNRAYDGRGSTTTLGAPLVLWAEDVEYHDKETTLLVDTLEDVSVDDYFIIEED